MEVVSMRNYSGRNIYSHKPVIKMIVDLGSLAHTPTNKIRGFNNSLLEHFPGLSDHYCSLGYKGGFIQRLEEGTLVSHVTEHLALELQCIMGYDVHFGKTRVVEEPYVYYILYEYSNEACAIEAGYAAAKIVLALARRESISIEYIEDILDQLHRLSFESELGPSTKAIYEEARHRNIPIRRLDNNSLLQLGYGKDIRYIEASLPDATSSIAVDLVKNKLLAKSLLNDNGIPVPSGGCAESEYKAVVLAEEIGYPVVVKPFDANQGKGVTVNINDEDLLRKAYQSAQYYSDRVMVEKHMAGKDYRVLVVGDKVAAVAERKPPFVIGDGSYSIAELVARENRNSNRGIGHEKPLTKIYLDCVAEELLARGGLSIDDVPEAGKLIYLRENGNLSTGGCARDCTTEIHPHNKELAIKAAKVVGLEVAGIDIIIDDISLELTHINGAVIEVNAAPGLRMHLYPTEGKSNNVAAEILDYMYPEGTQSSIPIISITGTNGKTTVTRLIRHVIALTGATVGMTCSSGTYIGAECLSQGDNTGPASARSILYNKEVDVAVLETARGGLIRSGLGYDLADVGIIVNISEDHLGVDGIDFLEDLAFVKSLVVEAVKPEGYAVLNADDAMAKQIIRNVRCKLMLFSQNKSNSLIEKHISQGGMAVVAENNLICFYHDETRIEIIKIDDIPITFSRKAICNVENSLAAIAGLIALDVPLQVIQSGLMSFTPDPIANAGRFNLFDMDGFQILLDYGHNLGGYQSVIQFAKTMDASRVIGIIGMPGDRLDKAINEVATMAGQAFTKIYIKEDKDLRGRQTGEVAAIMYSGALNGGIEQENVEIVLSETEALEAALKEARPGDLVVMFYERFEENYKLIQEYKWSLECPAPLLSLTNVAASAIKPLSGELHDSAAVSGVI